MHFAIDDTAFLILIGILFLIYLGKNFLFPRTTVSLPSLAFSRLHDLSHSSWRSRLADLPKKLHLFAISCFMIAFIDPHLTIPSLSSVNENNTPMQTIPTEGIAIYLILDQSGSMAEPISVTVENGQSESIPKINLLKKVTKQFILDHPSDLIGLVAFARVPRVLVPLTLDQGALLSQLQRIPVVKNPNEDGTAMGYAIYKTANLLSATRHFADEANSLGHPPYTIKSAIIIAVTDGFQDPSRLDKGNRLRTIELDEAATYAKSQNIRLYIVNIDPILSTTEYAPQRRLLQAITEETGGQFFLVSDAQELQDIYKMINQLEKGTINQQINLKEKNTIPPTRYASLYPYFLLIGILSLFCALLLESTLLRRVP